MMLPTVALLSFAVALSSASRVVSPIEVIEKGNKNHCDDYKCMNKKLPPYMNCAKMEIPDGECCPVCSCTDNKGNSYEANSRFEMTKDGHCWNCDCFVDSEGIKQAACYKRYCAPASCPPFLRERTSDGCCEVCPARRPRTFPPRPNGRTFPPRPNGR